MQKSIRCILFDSLLLHSPSRNHYSNSSRPLIPPISSSFTFNRNRFCSTTPDIDPKNSVLANYLIDYLKFPKSRALSVCSSYARTKSLENPKDVVHFFRGLGFSDAHIQSTANGAPRILFSNVEKILKPKVTFLQESGLSGPNLCSLISKTPVVLTHSLDRTLKPCLHFIFGILRSGGRCVRKEQVSHDLVRILTRSSTIVRLKPRMEANITYLMSCGIDGSQLSTLLLVQPRLLAMPKEKVEELVSRAVEMNFTTGSRMLVYGIRALAQTSIKKLNSRFEFFRMFGFSKDEVASIFRNTPLIFGHSEENLRCKLDFFLNILKMDRLVLVRNPALLGLSLEGRVIPRCKVVEILKSRGLLNEGFNLPNAMFISNQKFSEKYILSFKDDVEELLLEAYKGKHVDTFE